MRNLLLALLHIAVVTAKLIGAGGVRAVMAENLLLKQQLIVLRRARKRAPNLMSSDRLLCGFWSLFLSPGRIRKAAIALRPSTLPAFHHALVRRKYRRLFSSTPCAKKVGPKGPSDALIQAIVELKSRNPRFGCPRIARIISQTFGVDIDKNVVHRVLEKHYRPAPSGIGPSWLSFIGHIRDSLWSVDLFSRGSQMAIAVDASPSCCGAIGYSWSWTNLRVASSASACTAALSPAPTSVACSTPRFMVRVYRVISVPIMIRCSRRTGGRRTFGF
jgi:hypothetical protein